MISSYHVRLLSEGSVADLADEGLLAGVDLEVLLKVEALGVDEEATNWTALVIRPEQGGGKLETKVAM